jgi:hypothetical protein
LTNVLVAPLIETGDHRAVVVIDDNDLATRREVFFLGDLPRELAGHPLVLRKRHLADEAGGELAGSACLS